MVMVYCSSINAINKKARFYRAFHLLQNLKIWNTPLNTPIRYLDGVFSFSWHHRRRVLTLANVGAEIILFFLWQEKEPYNILHCRRAGVFEGHTHKGEGIPCLAWYGHRRLDMKRYTTAAMRTGKQSIRKQKSLTCRKSQTIWHRHKKKEVTREGSPFYIGLYCVFSYLSM